jgi:hypothetical protein
LWDPGSKKSETRGTSPIPAALPGSLIVVTSRDYGVRGAATPPVPCEGTLATGLGAAGGEVVDEVLGAVVVTVPFTLFFCFLPRVLRAVRVALAFWALATSCSAVNGVGTFRGVTS